MTSWFRTFISRFIALFRRRDLEKKLQEELDFHLEMQVEENLRNGMKPEEARNSALRSFGGLDQTKEKYRDERNLRYIEDFMQDVRYGLRMLHQHKGLTAVVILSLALGIGANTALFSAVDSIFINTLPVYSAEDLVAFRWTGNNVAQGMGGYGYVAPDPAGGTTSASFPLVALQALRTAPGLEHVFAFARSSMALVENQGEAVNGQFVTGNYYRALGVKPVLGRVFRDEDDMPGSEPVAVISEEFWQRRFGMDPEILETTMTLNDLPLVIIGVVPAGLVDLRHVSSDIPDISIPLSMESRLRQGNAWLTNPRNWALLMMGRTGPGASIVQLQTDLQPVFERAIREDYLGIRDSKNQDPMIPQLIITDGSRGVYDVDRATVFGLTILSAVFGIVLVIVCINVANLMLSRSEARQKEMAARLAIGASRMRLIRQLVTESLILAALGGGIGTMLAYACIPLIPLDGINMDETVLVFAAILTLASGTFFGLTPALRSSRVGWVQALKEGAPQVAHSRSLLGRSLIVAQIGLTLLLLIVAGLFVRTLQNLKHVATGFNPRNVLILDVDSGVPFMQRMSDPSVNRRLKQSYDEILERLGAIAGVHSVTLSSGVLLDGSYGSGGISIEGQNPDAPSSTYRLTVDYRFFETMGIPLKLGRSFTRQDCESKQSVAVVNEEFARVFFPHDSPIGKRFGGRPDGTGETEIVGIVGNVKYVSLREDAQPMVYISRRRDVLGIERTFLLRSSLKTEVLVPAIRKIVTGIDPNMTLSGIRTQISELKERYKAERLFALLSTAFSGLVLILSMIGLIGLMSYSVARRTRELGIRMALGAEAGRIRFFVLRESWFLVGIGIIFGVAAAMASTRFLESILFGLAPNDPGTIIAASALMFLVATLAGYLPARRASQIDPLVALRYE